METDGASQALNMQPSQSTCSPAQHKPQFSRRSTTLETNITSSDVYGAEMAFARNNRQAAAHSELMHFLQKFILILFYDEKRAGAA